MKGERVGTQKDAEPPEKVAVRGRNDPRGFPASVGALLGSVSSGRSGKGWPPSVATSRLHSCRTFCCGGGINPSPDNRSGAISDAPPSPQTLTIVGASGGPRSVTHSAWSGIGPASAGVHCTRLMNSTLLWMTVRSAPRSFASKFFVYR